MSDQVVNIKLVLNAEGIQKVEGDLQRIAKLKKQAEDITTGTKSGSAAAKKAGFMGEDYGTARGAIGTGAEGRDFAKQAQGLGGLVHVYATFAANLFAVGAAFRALSDAADTTNMIKGLDQLSVSSGKALGTLSKQLVATTDGAISLREAMEATTKGSAAGLNSEQMLQLGEVAKKASQALGISMPDAVSRLSRGISKLEPELLDELGLFTKLEKATQDYARSIGKPVSALTDFERRQAFANAVLKEGIDKFKDINIDANPYDKLLSSLKNVAQQSLEFINMFLGPLVKLLASSPVGLYTILGAIGGLLLKQAIPALGKYREGLAATAEQSRLAFAKMYRDQNQTIDALMLKSADAAEAAYRSSSAVLNKTKELATQAGKFENTAKKRWSELAAKDPFEMTSAELRSLENRQRTLQKSNSAEAALFKQHIIDIKRLRAEASAAADVGQNIAEKKYAGLGSTAQMNDILYKRQLTAASMDNIKSMVAEHQATYGMRSAFKELGVELNKARAGMRDVTVGIDDAGNKITEKAPKIGMLQYTFTGISGSIQIVATKIGQFVNVFAGTFGAVLAGVQVLGMLHDVFTKNAYESKKFSEAMEQLHSAGSLVEEVMKNIAKQGNNLFSVESIIARANAFNELSISIAKSVAALENVDKKAGGFDRFIDGFLVPIGKDIKSNFAREMAVGISAGIESMPEGSAKDELQAKIQKILGTTDTSFDKVQKAFDNLDPKAVIKAGKDIDKAWAESNKRIQEASKPLRQLQEDFNTLDKSFGDLMTSLSLSDPLSKFGLNLATVGITLNKVFKDPQTSLGELTKLLEDTNKLSLLPPSSIAQVFQVRKEVESLNADISFYTEQLKAGEANLKALKEENPNPRSNRARQLPGIILETQQGINESKTNLDTTNQRMTALMEKGSKIQLEALEKGLALIERGVKTAIQQASISMSQNRLAGVEGPEAAARRGELTQQAIDIQIETIKSQVSLAEQVLLSRLATEDLTAELAQGRLQDKKDRGVPLTKEEETRLESLDKLRETLSTVRPILEGKQKEPKAGTLTADAESYLVQRRALRAGVKAQIAEKEGEKGKSALNTKLEVSAAEYAVQQKLTKLEADKLAIQTQRNALIEGSLPFLSEERLTSKAKLENDTLSNQQKERTQSIEKVIEDLKIRQADATEKQTKDLPAITADLERQKDYLEKTKSLNTAEIEFLRTKQGILGITNAAAKATIERNEKAQAKDQSLRIAESGIENAKRLLDVKVGLGIITDEDAEKQRKSLEAETLQAEALRDSYRMQVDMENKLAEIATQRAVSQKAGATAEDLKAFDDRKVAVEKFYEVEKQLIDRNNKAKQDASALNNSMSDKMKGFAKIVEEAFNGMADALVEFVKTGKLNFSDLIASLMADLLKFELRAQFSSLYKSMRAAGGLLDFLGPVASAQGNVFDGMNRYAQGARFDYGIEKFAMGGAFTNQIVDSPTMFKFAQGTGLMGEAGPEAIMPLTRDASGTLGVKAQNAGSGKVDIVINNFSNEKATAEETTDARGNRRIEVTVGDMAAGEISRSGSNSQRSMRNTYGLQPQLIRR